MNFLSFAFKDSINEIRENWSQFKSPGISASLKSKRFALFYLNVLSLVVLTVLFLYGIYVIIFGIFSPIGYILLIPLFLFLLFLTLIRKHAYPKLKYNLLNGYKK